MPKVDISKAKVRTGSNYPPQFQNVVQGREKSVLGDLVGLTQFGVNLTRLKPGAGSALRHWHENEDEFVYILEGELVLVEDEGETLLRTGDAAGFKAGVANGHHLVNRTQRDAVYLEIGTRAPTERAHYPDVDLEFIRDKDKVQVRHKSGEPYA
ncbi:MAG: cupin domain-containing protein [Xanthobacteraceae bacterium]|jgi:uncharacterized cupin superfamily protein